MSKLGTPSNNLRWNFFLNVPLNDKQFFIEEDILKLHVGDSIRDEIQKFLEVYIPNPKITNVPSSLDDITIDSITYNPAYHESDYDYYNAHDYCNLSDHSITVHISWPMTDDEVRYHQLEKKKQAEKARQEKEKRKIAQEKNKLKREQEDKKRLELQAKTLKKKMDADPEFAERMKQILEI